MSFEFDFTEEKLAHIIPKAKGGVGVWRSEEHTSELQSH